MKVRLLLILAVGLAVGLAVRADTPEKNEAAKDLERFQGEWNLVATEVNGVKVDGDKVEKAGFILSVEGDKLTVKRNGETRGTATIKLDPEKKPKAYDLAATDAAGQKHDALGIYKFDGDTLTACYVAAGKDRPTEFQAGAGSEAIVQVWKRAKK